jgi:hypothetical protein
MVSADELPLIATTYVAHTTEEIYRHLRTNMEREWKVHKFVKKIMEEKPSRALNWVRSSLNTGSGEAGAVNAANTQTTDVPLEIIVHTPDSETTPPGPNSSLIEHIQAAYEKFKKAEQQDFLMSINGCLARDAEGRRSVEDTELLRLRGSLEDKIMLAETLLELKLSNKT